MMNVDHLLDKNIKLVTQYTDEEKEKIKKAADEIALIVEKLKSEKNQSNVYIQS